MLVFIDETGDHNLASIDAQYPLFGLGALIISDEQYVELNSIVSRLKKDVFNDDGTFILHSSELKRPTHPKSDPRNRIMLDAEIRKSFFDRFDREVIQALDFKLVACFIHKQAMADTYRYPADPYCFSFENLINRILRASAESNQIYAEARGPELDDMLLAEYDRLLRVGPHFFPASTFASRVTLTLASKKENINGLQVIDLILASLARDSLGKTAKMSGNDLAPELVKGKYACPPTFFPT